MTMNILHTAITKDYLGFCEQHGYIYSAQTSLGYYRIIGVKGNTVTELIAYEAAPIHPEQGGQA